jgi:hypothetical protein
LRNKSDIEGWTMYEEEVWVVGEERGGNGGGFVDSGVEMEVRPTAFERMREYGMGSVGFCC